jgi:predicted small metal-binding protein
VEETMQKVINCPCGFVVKGESDEQLVAKAQQHAKEVHQMDLSREQALAMAKPV